MKGAKTARPQTFEGRPLAHPDEELFDQGLRFDLETHLGRRSVLRLLGTSAFGVVLAGCGASSLSSSAGGTTAGGQDGGAACAVIPEETAGPYPADGSNGPDILGERGIVRSDIRSSFDGLEGTAEGVPLTIELLLQDAGAGCTAMTGAAVYLWHCDRDGQYSLYTLTDQNYLRGVQAADEDGVITFASIFPGCYAGRWPHIHFEVYPDLEAAASGSSRLATSQIALPQDACEQVSATAGYEQSVTNLQQVSLATDNVFGEDGGERQLGTMS